MKIALLNPPYFPKFSRSQRSPAVTKSGTIYYPFWLTYATGVLEKEGFEVKLIDAPAGNISLDETLNIIKNFSPKLLVMDTSTPSIYNDIGAANKIKEAMPDSFIVLVGPHVSSLAEETLLYSDKVDAIARGEYELTILDLAKSLSKSSYSLDRIQGLSYRADSIIKHNPDRPLIQDLDTLPFLSKLYKKHLNIKNYFFAASLYPEVQIFTARGCPYNCFFCLWPQCFMGRVYRARSPENVLEEFLYIKEYLPEVKSIVIEDDTFTVDKNRVRKICELLIANKVNIKWNANVRPDLDYDTMRLMKRSGCYLVITGFESSDQSILDNINKGMVVKQLKDFFVNARKSGLLIHAAFMAGNPGETKETLKQTLDFAKTYLPDTAQFFPLMAYPGTKAYEWAKEKGFLNISSYKDYLTKEGLHKCVINLPGLSSRDIEEWCDKSRASFYLNPKYILYKLKQILSNPAHMGRTLKALSVFIKYLFKGPKKYE